MKSPNLFLLVQLLALALAVPSQAIAKSPAPPQNPSVPVAKVSFRADEPADLKIDGQPIGKISPDDLLSRNLELGDHLIQATSAKGELRWEKVVTLENTYNKIVSIEFAPLRHPKSAAGTPAKSDALPAEQANLKGTWYWEYAFPGDCVFKLSATIYVAGFAPNSQSSQAYETEESDNRCPGSVAASTVNYLGLVVESRSGEFSFTRTLLDCKYVPGNGAACRVGAVNTAPIAPAADGKRFDMLDTEYVKKSDTVPSAILDQIKAAAAAPPPALPASPPSNLRIPDSDDLP